MNTYKNIFLSLSLLWCQSCSLRLATTNHNRITINLPTIEQEATSVWRTINDIVFLESQGYQINLPKNDLLQSLIEKSKKGDFGNDDFSAIYHLLETDIYSKNNYQLALKKVNAQEQQINQLIHQLYTSKKTWDWGFKTFENYNIVFTLYGTGGSYDPDLGTVTLFTTLEGQFMNYDNPVNTIIHEIVHMGVEESIIQNYKIPHGLKERLVDNIVLLLFGKFLPEYQIQNIGDPAIDQLLKKRKDLDKLDAIVEGFLIENK